MYMIHPPKKHSHDGDINYFNDGYVGPPASLAAYMQWKWYVDLKHGDGVINHGADAVNHCISLVTNYLMLATPNRRENFGCIDVRLGRQMAISTLNISCMH